MTLEANLARVQDRIAEACAQANRDPADIHILAVTKRHPISVLEQALACGLTDLAENRVQEALPKCAALPDARIHLIGQLQSNKVNKAVGVFASIASIDRVDLLEKVARRATDQGIAQPIWIQVNATGEPQKGGVGMDAAADLWARARELPGVRPQGVMAMGRAGDPEAALRATFAGVRQLAADWTTSEGTPAALSLGMSDDFPLAVLEGATHLRLGTVLFGPRPA